MCGFPGRVRVIKPVPTRVCHSAKDSIVSLREFEVMGADVKVSGGDVRFSIYPEADHDSWTETYNPEFSTWLLQQRGQAQS
jgi:hypothetical protein